MNAFDPTNQSMRSAAALNRGETRKTLRKLEHPRHGVVRPAGCRADPDLLRISDAVALMNAGHVLGGWAALRAQGNPWFNGIGPYPTEKPVLLHCLGGAQLRRRAGIVPCRGLLYADEFLYLENYAVTTLARAAYDEMCSARSLREAVVAFDMATSTTSEVAHTTGDAITKVTESHHKTRGIVQARRAVLLGSSRSASPQESRTRLLAVLDAGLTTVNVNVPVFDRYGNLLGIADLFDPATGLVIESDGADHTGLERHTDDNRREEKFERAGAVVVRITSLDHRDRITTAARLRAAQRDARASTKREWTIDKPDWWWSWPHARRWQ